MEAIGTGVERPLSHDELVEVLVGVSTWPDVSFMEHGYVENSRVLFLKSNKELQGVHVKFRGVVKLPSI